MAPSAALPVDDDRHDRLPDSRPAAGATAVSFQVTLRDGSVEVVDDADAYAQEQSMTTFFRTGERRTVDCWSVRVASFRTDQILAVRRREHAPGAVLRAV